MRNRFTLLHAVTVLALLAVAAPLPGLAQEADITGDLKTWHRVTLTFDGPESSETGTVNPFMDYRLDAVFANGDTEIAVPGFFAADGDAAESGADSGTKWRVRFMPPETGQWRYTAVLRHGDGIAVSGEAGEVAGRWNGAFTVERTDATGRDARARGLLEYTGGRYLRWRETGGWFLKAGADSPENFLAYAGFDGTRDHDGLDREGEAAGGEFIHHYEPHVDDWRDGDPTWRNGRGKGMIGALNYLASKGMNSVYFITMNVAGDGKDVWPWTGYDERFRFDVSKLAQWEIVFTHMDRLGIMLHVLTQETENDQLLDGGDLGVQRKLYYRELIARFGHHPALVWNLGEENTNTTGQLKDFSSYIRDLDPYDHPIVVHTYPNWYDRVYAPLLGWERITGPSLQMGDMRMVHAETLGWIGRSARSGHQWTVFLDEIGPADVGVKPDADDYLHDDVRRYALWGHLMAGGAGVEWYFGYRYAHNDLNCEDWRSRDHMWDLTRHAVDFFRRYLPFTEMESYDELTAADDDYCFAKPFGTYAVYLPAGGTTTLDLLNSRADYAVMWYNPRTGGDLVEGSVAEITGPGPRSIGYPPERDTGDWVALIKRR